MVDMTTKVEELVNKAAASDDSGDAMRFSQAATNAANALITLTNIQHIQEKKK